MSFSEYSNVRSIVKANGAADDVHSPTPATSLSHCPGISLPSSIIKRSPISHVCYVVVWIRIFSGGSDRGRNARYVLLADGFEGGETGRLT